MTYVDESYSLTSPFERFARRVLDDLGLKEPPIQIQPVLDYFGINLHLVNLQAESEFQRITGERIEVPAFLYREGDNAHIFVREGDSVTRQRLSIFHECGHYHLPWHDGASYFCDCKDTSGSWIKRLEKEAFEYAEHLMFPPDAFYEDLRNISLDFLNIEVMSDRYVASFEATANKFVKCHPDSYAVFYLRPNPKADSSGYPFLVRYFVKSRWFHGFWRPGAEVWGNELIEKCFLYNECFKGEIPAYVFGSKKSHVFEAELKPHGPDQVCALLRIPNSQISLF